MPKTILLADDSVTIQKVVAISFASEDDAFLLPDLEALLGDKLECTHPPEELLA